MHAFLELHDEHNPENRVAGGISDLVKHTVYGCALRELLATASPPETGTVYECHAGRGMYFLPADDERLVQLRKLRQGVVFESRSRVLARLSCPDHWYPGSAALVADFIQLHAPASEHILLEWAPETRSALKSVCAALGHHGQVVEVHPHKRFDGETYLLQNVQQMTVRDIVLCDPFALFRQQKLHYRRQRYWRLMQAWKARPPAQRPAFVWFFSAPATVTQISSASSENPLRYSYEAFEDLLCIEPHLQIRYDYAFPCAIWVFAPVTRLEAIRHALDSELASLCNQLNVARAHELELRGIG